MTDTYNLHRTKRSILYYPSISIPANDWLRQALLYWDEVGSIVPQRPDGSSLVPLSPEIVYLQSEGEFRPFRPEHFLDNIESWSEVNRFEEEVHGLVHSPSFQRLLGPREEWRLVSHIHVDKLSDTTFSVFEEAGLARHNQNDDEWYLFERKTALLYMSILAKYIADADMHATVPGTDRREYEKLIYDARSRRDAYPCLDIRFIDTLPIPSQDVSLPDILEFKHRRRQELLHFREELDNFQKELSEADEADEIRHVLVSSGESIERGVNDLSDLLADAAIQTVAGSLKTMLDAKSPALWGSIGILFDRATQAAELPIEWTLPGLGMLGLIQVGYYWIHERNQRRAALRDSPFAYLYSASEEGLTQ